MSILAAKSEFDSAKDFNKPKKVEICSVTWEMNDHIEELDEILQGVSVAAVDNQLVRYVADNIEPTGWQAVWRANKKVSSDRIKQEADFIVNVIDVSQVKLDATVIVKDIVNAPEDSNKLCDIIDVQICVPLVELYPTSYQENDSINIQMITSVTDQLRFFFDHIWLPWDLFEEVCCYSKSLLSSRMQTYHQIKNEVIPSFVACEMSSLKQRGIEIANEIRNLEASFLKEDMVDEQQVVQLMKLNKELEQLKTRYDALGDPFRRELSLLQEQMERKDLLELCSIEEPANVLVVVSSMLLEDFVKVVSDLPEFLKVLPQSPHVSKVKTFPSLQIALDSAKVGDTIALLSGTHILKHLGSIAGGGIICGIGSGVSIVGSPATGDILLDLWLEKENRFVLHSVELRPLEFQTGILVHSGRMVIQQCNIAGGSAGISLLSESKCQIEGSSFSNIDLVGVQCKSDSELVIGNSHFENCQVAIQGNERAKIVVSSDVSVADCSKEFSIGDADDSVTKEIKDKILTLKGGKIKIKE